MEQRQINNIKPRTREEREAMREKDQIEKQRINQRNGYEARNQDLKGLLHNGNPQSTIFMPENERFDKDFANYDRRKREEEKQRKDLILEKHRMNQMERENQRWIKADQEQFYSQQKQEYHRDVLQAGKRNKNGMAFNPITLEYEKSESGKILAQKDDEAKVRELIRKGNLDARSNCGYNVITGETRQSVEIPAKLFNQFENKVKQLENHYAIKPNNR